MTELNRLQKLDQWQRSQRPNESVDDYVTSIQNAPKRIPVKETELIRLAIIRGLRPTIKLHVMQTNTKTVADVITAARLAEAALSATAVPSEASAVAELNKTVAMLVTQLQQQPNPAASTTSATANGEAYNISLERQPPQQPRSTWSQRPANVNQQYQRRGNTNYPRQYSAPRMERPWQQQYMPQGQQPQRQQYYNQQQPQQTTYYQNACRNCSRSHQTGACIAKDQQCFNCHKWGHFSRACRSRAAGPNTPRQ